MPEDEVERRHPDAKCESCEWYKRSAYAGASGPDEAAILVVGEAPGRVETDAGIPFTGPSGKLLDAVLKRQGLVRDDIRFTNVVACHPPYSPTSKSVKPPKEVIAACAPRLRSEIKEREAILLLGNTAAAAVLDDRSAITKLRQGPPREKDGAIVVPTIHPAAALRSSDYFPDLVRDVSKFAKALSGDSIFTKWEPPIYKDFDEPQQAMEVLKELLKSRYPAIAVDIECDVDKDQSFTHPNELLCVGISYAPNKAIVIGEEALKFSGVRLLLKELLHEKKVICHNGKYDLQVLWRVGIIDEPLLWFDTMVASYTLDERPGHHGLENRATEILGAPSWKAEIKKYTGTNGSYALVPRPILYRYNAWDVSQTFLLYLHYEKELGELRQVHDMFVEMSVELTYVEFEGIGVDKNYLGELTTSMVESLTGLEEQLLPWVENPRSFKQVGAALKDLKLVAADTGVETLTNLYKKQVPDTPQHEFLRLMLQQRKEQKLYGTYVKGTAKRMIDGRVYPTYLVHGTVFGRLSARNPNIHNIPRGSLIKRLFVPSDGNVFVQCDYSQAELRVMACEAQDAYLRDVFRNPNRDIHNEVSDTLYGEGNWTKSQRVRTKAFVFGSAYGREPFSIATEFGLRPHEAEALYRGFMAMIPEVVEWRQQVQNKVFKEGQALETHFGRKRRFWLITRENKKDVSKESLAFIPQSTSSDLCLLSLNRIRREFGWSISSPKIRNTVHDSILVECDNNERAEVGQTMKRIMEETAAEMYSDYVPFTADPEHGYTYGDLSE